MPFINIFVMYHLLPHSHSPQVLIIISMVMAEVVLHQLLPHPFFCRFRTPPNYKSNPFFHVHQTLSPGGNKHVRCSSSSENNWIREEQRWLREEQRWLRQQSRWNTERETLLQEISDLNYKVQTLETQNLEIQNLVEEVLLDSEGEEELVEEVKVVVVEEKKPVMSALRKGSEGEDVRALQVALQKLGFYSGEEDVEYSSFSSGTERAVKTWQATVGVPEDGIMSEKLLETLFEKQGMLDAGKKLSADQEGDIITSPKKACENGATTSSVSGASEVALTVLKNNSFTEYDASQHRVFLLGENRWEEPSRLVGRGKMVRGKKKVVAATYCPTCLGYEGRVLCTECGGTGEPNIEPQFLELVDEGASCPYCEGLGYTVCDVCVGENITATPEKQNQLNRGGPRPFLLDT